MQVSVEAGRPRQLTVSAERTAAVDEQWTIRRSERYCVPPLPLGVRYCVLLALGCTCCWAASHSRALLHCC